MTNRYEFCTAFLNVRKITPSTLAFALGLLGLTSWPWVTQAAVTDEFSCQISVLERDGRTRLESRFNSGAVRKENDELTNATQTVTISNLAGEVRYGEQRADDWILAQIGYGFCHAVRKDGNGRAIEAKQYSSVGFCAGLDSSVGLCGDSAGCTICEPFDPECTRWKSVPIVDGVPQFDTSEIEKPVSLRADTGESLQMSCEYLGTVR